MLSPYKEMKAIYKRLGEIESVTNPSNDKFMTRNDDDHPLCPERDALLKTYWQYKSYERWFNQR